MMANVNELLKKLNIDKKGDFKGDFYVIPLESSDEYIRMYSRLNDSAINTENPSMGANSNDSTVKITNYFEIDNNDMTYNIFLIANFDSDTYYVKIGEKK